MDGTNRLNPGNTCAHLEVLPVSSLSPMVDMYNLQLALQARLNEVPAAIDDLNSRVPNVLYWKYCVDEEFQELTEWLNVPAMEPANLKELQMEYIDMLHFMFNIGIALSVPASVIGVAFYDCTYPIAEVKTGTLMRLLSFKHALDSQIVQLVGLLPWKRWKSYQEIHRDQVLPEIFKAYLSALKLFITMGGVVGMDLQTITDFFYAKNKENHHRQDRGY